MTKRILLVFILMTTLVTGCSSFETFNLDTTSPVEINHGFFDVPITQEGRTLDHWNARAKFSELPEARSNARASLIYEWTDIGVAAATVGYIIESDHTGPVFTSVLLGSVVSQVVLLTLSRVKLQDAAADYNKQFSSKPKSVGVEFKPFFSPVYCGAVAGLGFTI